MTTHIIPNNDTHKHTRSKKCACSPVVTERGHKYYIVRHNAYDNRESDERATGKSTDNKNWNII